eukprot:COSAG01_NODE_647_length_14531_cov_61.773489_5_plen_105_part_00
MAHRILLGIPVQLQIEGSLRHTRHGPLACTLVHLVLATTVDLEPYSEACFRSVTEIYSGRGATDPPFPPAPSSNRGTPQDRSMRARLMCQLASGPAFQSICFES